VLRRSLIPALVLLILALGSVDAHAAPFTFTYAPSNPVAGQAVTFTADRDKGNKDADVVWDFDDGTVVETTGSDKPTHVFDAARTYDVKLSVKKSDGTTELQATTPITVAPAPDPPPPPPPANTPPSASFSFAPSSPVAGDEVTFTGGSDPDGDSVTRFWDFGDGATDSGPTPGHSYASAGEYTVTLTVTDSHGESRQTFQSVTVRARPSDASAPSTGEVGGSGPSFPALTGATGPFPMRPFPIVRIAGVVFPRGALIRILSVRGPRGMQVRVRCRGSSCPVGSTSRTSARRLARLHRFERRLAAGTTLELFVRQPGRIGKYTRFVIRAGEAPARVDRCLVPGRTRPVRCR
jgi:PKD repeat protein